MKHCLTFLTIASQAVPEAMPKINNSRSGETGRSEQSMVRTAYHTSHQPRVYPEDHKEGASLVDAAGFWNSNALGAGEVSSSAADELGRTFADHKLSPQRNKLLHTVDNGLADPPTASSGRKKGEGGLLPFDLEVPVAYGSVSANTQVAVTDINSGAVVSTGGMGVVEEGEAVSGDARETTPILENIESERVPCPRLCGATFGFGNGGLVMFHNGEIKKMWNWFQRTDTIRLSSVPSGKAENSSSDPELLSPRVDVSNTENRTMASGPRTLKELVHMMKTAKEVRFATLVCHIIICKCHSPLHGLFFYRHNGENETGLMVLDQMMTRALVTISSRRKVWIRIALILETKVLWLTLPTITYTTGILERGLGKVLLKKGTTLAVTGVRIRIQRRHQRGKSFLSLGLHMTCLHLLLASRMISIPQ
jgi:hypothetical protein